MRRSIAAVALISLLSSLPAPASADHRPNTYCSESGDICQSVARVDGVRTVTIKLAARYFARYDFCLSDRRGFDYCKRFRIEERRNGVYGDSFRLTRHFHVRRGAYSARWFRVDDARRQEQVGRTLGFHVR